MFGISMVTYVVGEPGSGKTYRRCAVFLADEFLPNYTGRIWTNYPINVPVMAAYVARKTGRPAQEIADRIKIIPRDILIEWRRGKSGPWEFFEGIDTAGDFFALDEVHKYIPKRKRAGANADQVIQWEEFLGEIRHREFVGSEFLTQDPAKVHECIENHAGLRLVIEKDESRYDPLFKIPMKAWYELIACWITRRYEPANWQVIQRRSFKRWHTVWQSRFMFNGDYFALYDSYSKDDQRGKVHVQPTFEFQRRTRLGLTWWFFTRNPTRFLIVIVLAILYMSLFTGHAAQAFGWATQRVVLLVSPSPTTAAKTSKLAPAAAASGPTPTQQIDPGTPMQDVQPVHMVPLAELEALQARLAEVEAKRSDLERRLGEASAVLMIAGETVTFRDGYTVTVGQRIEFGEFKDEHVERIDFRQRAVVLGDGRVLRMGGGLFGSSIRVGDTDTGNGRDIPTPPK